MDDIDLKRFGWAPGGYMIRCVDCADGEGAFTDRPVGDKRSWRCRSCAVDAAKAESANPPTTRSGWMEAGV